MQFAQFVGFRSSLIRSGKVQFNSEGHFYGPRLLCFSFPKLYSALLRNPQLLAPLYSYPCATRTCQVNTKSPTQGQGISSTCEKLVTQFYSRCQRIALYDFTSADDEVLLKGDKRCKQFN